MDAGRYLDRLGYDGPTTPSLAVLRALHRAHLERVPFEDLDIHRGLGIRLEAAWLFRKIVLQQRGGICYELNGAFGTLLEVMGFNVTRLSARVFREDGRLTPPFDHMVLLVKLQERWLADVGFGECFRVPLRLDELGEQPDGFGVHRLEPTDDEAYIVHQCLPGKPWTPRYRFTLTPRRMGQFRHMAHFHGTSPESHFAQRKLCTRATPDGRITLDENALVMSTGKNRVELPAHDEAARQQILHKQFGIVLD